jgi:N-acetylglucosamine-6-phosphate deacetylase
MPGRLLLTNCRLFDAHSRNETTSVLIDGGIIRRMGQGLSADSCDSVLDARGRIIAPGFIDVHIQGAGGADVLDGTVEALETLSKTCARFGTTGFLATTVFRPGGNNQHLGLTAECMGRDLGGAQLLGIHLEGPFISMQKRGMILPECICPPSSQVFDEIQDATKGHLKMMTIAPEQPESLPVVRSLVESGVIASFGHSSASFEQTLEGFDAGISHVTHLFNAMPSIHHRAPGPLVAIFQTADISVQVITDGVHIHPAVLRLAFEKLGPNRTIPITDGMQAIGLGDGKFVYNGVEYESKQGAARYKDGTLIGTALGLNQMLQRLVALTDCPLETAIRTVTENPAALLGLADHKGSIAVGKDADLVVLEDDLSVWATLVAGRVVFERQGESQSV